MLIKLSKDEEEAIYSLAEKLTGSRQSGRFRKTVIVQNVLRRMQIQKTRSLADYLSLVAEDQEEYSQLVSALTIHFTSFFRESEQFEPFLKFILEGREDHVTPLRILVAACSSGEEAYSLGLFLEKQRLTGRIVDYKITAFDIDPKSVRHAKKGIYSKNHLRDIPLSYRSLVLQGSGDTADFFTFDKQLRNRIQWFEADLRRVVDAVTSRGETPFDGVSCRNVLIYFDEKGVRKVLDQLLSCIKHQGVLCLGHSESIQVGNLPLSAKGRSLYILKPKSVFKNTQSKRALVVDDSHTIRKILSAILTKAGFAVESVDSADGATKFISEHQVDLITLDLNMPIVDGATWLRQQRKQGLKTPVVIVSDSNPKEAEAVLGALLGGAEDYIFKQELSQKPSLVGERLRIIADQYANKIQLKKVTPPPSKGPSFGKFNPEMIVIASSTGGTEALVSLLGLMPVNCPPILIVQHITHGFSEAFFRRLVRVSGLKPGTIRQDAPILPGHLYMALEDYHIGVRRVGDHVKLDLSYAPPENSVRPAADVLFRSVARLRIPAMGLILTGMGKDGASGILELKQAGCYTLAQDEESCVVFGMPREAILQGGIHFVGNIRSLRSEIDQCLLLPRQEAKSA
jgi:two-component system chemotaxis response regulator CheB